MTPLSTPCSNRLLPVSSQTSAVMYFSSEVDVEYVVIQVFGRVMPEIRRQRQFSDLVWYETVGIWINHRNLPSPLPRIRIIIGKMHRLIIPVVNNGRKEHRYAWRWLIINVDIILKTLEQGMKVKPCAHPTDLQSSR